MMAVIHGKSHTALKHFRAEPAALAVYWIYVSRANYENVAWPSARGLARDTGWNRETCRTARRWLVDRGALEMVEKYIRPEWRELPEAERKKRVGLDRSEYYRPTGKITVDGKEYPLLYFGGDEPSDIEEELTPEIDGLPHRPSTPQTVYPTDRLQGEPELDSIEELDSKKQNVIPEEERAAEAAPSAGDVFKTYETNIGLLTPYIHNSVKVWLEDVPAGWVIEALNLAVEYNKRSWAYAEAILKRWQTQGKDDGRLPKSNNVQPDTPTVIRTVPDMDDLDEKLNTGGTYAKFKGGSRSG